MNTVYQVCTMVVAGLITGCSKGETDTGTATDMPTEGSLSVLTYNVHGLPAAITGDDTTARMGEIAPRLETWDILGIQESFDPDNHDILTGESSHDTRLWFGDMLPERFYGSGLAVLARAALVDHQHTHYSTCNGITDSSSDCLASKGFQAVRLQMGTSTIDVYNTHLEAGGGTADNESRQTHIDEVLASINGWSAGHAIVFTGDFNLRPSDPDDLPLIEQLLDQGGLSDSCSAMGCDESDHIDQILFRSSDSLTLEVTAWTNRATNFIDGGGVDLSDHPAISSSFAWSNH
jgi:endonuclease/exonuclease/phosphatase family metal-dependent hydrolase